MLPLLWQRIGYANQDASLLKYTLCKIEVEPLNPNLPLLQVVHCQGFTTHYSWYCSPRPLLTLDLLWCIKVLILILCHPHHNTSFLLYPSYLLSAKSMLLMNLSPHISTGVSSSILIHYPCHLSCDIPLYLSDWFHPDFLICLHLNHTISLPTTSLLSYIYDASMLSPSPLFHISDASASIITRLCRLRLHHNTYIFLI